MDFARDWPRICREAWVAESPTGSDSFAMGPLLFLCGHTREMRRDHLPSLRALLAD